jgi:hypothetical protein
MQQAAPTVRRSFFFVLLQTAGSSGAAILLLLTITRFHASVCTTFAADSSLSFCISPRSGRLFVEKWNDVLVARRRRRLL